MTGTDVEFRTGGDLDLDAVLEVYRESTLAERRPAGDRRRMAAMLDHADLVVSAWEGDRIVGLARSLTDRAYVIYLADLAVRVSHQRRGIGRALVARTQAACEPGTSIVLLAAPAAADYYPRLGFVRHPSAWVLHGTETAPQT